MAVKLALAETHIMEENKQYFAGHGIDLKTIESTEKGPESTAGWEGVGGSQLL
jgi:hypothetical protein